MVAAQTQSPARMLMLPGAPQPEGYEKPKARRKRNDMEEFIRLLGPLKNILLEKALTCRIVLQNQFIRDHYFIELNFRIRRVVVI